MDFTLPAALALAAFWSRDYALISQGRALRISYAVLACVLWFACSAVAESLSKDELHAILARRETWMTALLMHGGLMLLGYWWRDRTGRLCWLALLPTPVLLLSALHTSWFLLRHWTGSTYWMVGAGLAACWIVPMLVLVFLRPAGPQTAQGLAAGSNLSALLLLPFSGPSQDAPGTAAPVDGVRTAVALGSTLVLIAASYLVHRTRQFTWKGNS